MAIDSDSWGPLLAPTPPGSGFGKYVRGVDIRVLGPLDVRVNGESVQLGGPKQRALFALLVAASPRVVSTDALIEGLWGEEPSAGARSTLQTYVSNLRQSLGGGLVHDRGGYRLDVDPESIDAVRFQGILKASRTRLTTDPGATASALREALSLWQGRPYADLIDVPGLEADARLLEELRLEAVELRIDADLASGLHGTLVAELDALAEEHPTREHFRSQHMLALYRSGRQAEALRAYRRTQSFLAEELGVEPSRELQELELKILQQDESLLGGTVRTVTQRLAFLVTDIEGSTRLWDRHPQEMADALATHDRVLRETIESEGGRVFKHTGDGLLAAFSDTFAAVSAAERGLRSLAASDWGELGEVKIRIGIDVGEAETRGNDFFGPPVNRATRLCAIGHGGQVLVSSSAQAELSAAAPTGLQIRHLGEIRLRGLATPEPVAQLVFVGMPADFPDLRLDAESDLDQRLEVLSVPGYEVRDRIGEGAYGVVWRAYQPSVGREVAIKAIRQELASQPSFVRRFEAEARTIARLAHPHIVPLIDFWRDSESAYLVLGLLRGGSLATAMAARLVDRSMARKVLGQIGNALDHAHSQGMVHGDVKPANVLLDGAGNAYLSDFGLAARLLYPDVVSSCSTDPAYRAPEETETGPSPAGDRYALGVMAGALLDGDPGLDDVLARAAAPRPDDRFESSAAFVADLDRVMGREAEAVPPVVSRNPYKGLRAFEEGDSADFYGRDELIATLLAALSEHRFVTVVGPSGSGKSSAVLAGLLPRLASGAHSGSASWARSVFTPGSDPLVALADAIEAVSTEPVGPEDLTTVGLGPAVDGELLLVIDQFEELYTLTDSPEQRDRFIEIITGAVTDPQRAVRVVATLRADFYDRPLEDPELGRLVRDGLVTVLAPARNELVEMIVAPSQNVGLRWEPGLPHRIAEDVAHQPGGLPLLQYALTELVERRSGDLLTTTDYERVHGVGGALATRAESIYRDLNPSQQEAVRQVLLRLVTVDEESDDTRRRVRRSELESIGISRADLDAVLETFTSQRLFLADRDPATRGPTVEVAHEALLREWPRLQTWVDDQREALILGRRFRAALADWEAAGRHDDYLLTGSRLAPFMGWAETAALNAEEQGFYHSSRDKDDRERLTRRRRRRTLTWILAGAAFVASTLGILAALQAQRATDEAQRALAAEERAGEEAERASRNADLARSRELAASAISVLEADPSLSKLLALAASSLADPPVESISALHRAWAADPVVERYRWPEESFLWTDLHPSGRLLLASAADPGDSGNYLEVADLETGEVLWSHRLEEESLSIGPSYFSPDGERVIAGVYWQQPENGATVDRELLGIHIWDARNGELMHRFDLGRCGGLVGGTSDTHLLVRTFPDDTEPCWNRPSVFSYHVGVELIELRTGERRMLTERSLLAWDQGASLSTDGRFVAFDLPDDPPRVVVLEVATGETVLEFDPLAAGPTLAGVRELNGDGSLLLYGDRPMQVWDVFNGELITSFEGHAGESNFAVFGPSDRTLYSTGRDLTLRHWDATTGDELSVLRGVGNGRVSISEPGLVLVADTDARTASLIDPGLRGEVGAVETCAGFTAANSLSVGDGTAVFLQQCGDDLVATSQVVDLAARELRYALSGTFGQVSPISPDASRFVRQEARGNQSPPANLLGTVTVRDLLSGEVITELEGLCTYDNLSTLPREDSSECQAFPNLPFGLWASQLRWSPDGNFVAALDHPGFEGYLAVWDARRGDLLFTRERPPGVAGFGAVIFTPDSEELILYHLGGLTLERVSTNSWKVTAESVLDYPSTDASFLTFIGFAPDGMTLYAAGGLAGGAGGDLHWIDPETLKLQRTVQRIHDGSLKTAALGPDGALIATGSSDGLVRVWDAQTGSLMHEIPFGETQVQGVAFVDESHLAVTPQEGNLLIVTIDTGELLEIVRSSLTRGFTETECEKFNFEAVCPSLEELRSGTG